MQRKKMIHVEQLDGRFYITLICEDGGVKDDIGNPYYDSVDAESRALRLSRHYDCQWERANYSQK